MASLIKLNGIELNQDMEWLERYQSASVAQTTRRTLGGRMVIYNGELVAGQPITLQASDNMGWLRKSVVDQLLVLAQDPVGAYVLEFNDVNYNVVFRHSDAPAVDMEPIRPLANQLATDWMMGQIKLLTI